MAKQQEKHNNIREFEIKPFGKYLSANRSKERKYRL